MTDWATNWRHLSVLGDSGAGKTTILCQLYETTPRLAIFIDPLRIIDYGTVAESLPEVKRLLQGGHGQITFRPNWDFDKALDEVNKLIEWCFKISTTTNNDIMLLCDEAHKYCKKRRTGYNAPLNRVLKEGRNKGIKGVISTQNPKKLNDSTLQAYQIWVGGYNSQASEYLDRKGFPISKIKQQEDYNAIVLNKNMEAIDSFKTNTSYSP